MKYFRNSMHTHLKLGLSIMSRNCSFSNNIDDRTVIVSRSLNIFENLSLEDWFYRNLKLSDGKRLLLMWYNKEAIVIGRHQNPWVECNIKEAQERGCDIARRQSGGGTVFHDLGNLNICFITKKNEYNRKRNLTFIADVLMKNFSIECEISPRENLHLKSNGYKISGTASKLASTNAYHHLTLLVDADLNKMTQFLKKPSDDIKSNATESIPSAVANLSSICSSITNEDVIHHLSKAFIKNETIDSYTEVLPVNKDFVGISKIEDELRSWDWVYGKTPRFTIDLVFPECFINWRCQVEIFHGRVENIKLEPENIKFPSLKGCKFEYNALYDLLDTWSIQENSSSHSLLVMKYFLNTCLKLSGAGNRNFNNTTPID